MKHHQNNNFFVIAMVLLHRNLGLAHGETTWHYVHRFLTLQFLVLPIQQCTGQHAPFRTLVFELKI